MKSDYRPGVRVVYISPLKALNNDVERNLPVPLDILAQQIVAMVSVEQWSFDDALPLVRGAYPFRNLSEMAFRNVLEMLSGKYPESVSRYLKALISWDRVNQRLAALPGANKPWLERFLHGTSK